MHQNLLPPRNGAATDPNHIANVNPFRYRGYYYDRETGFYYLQSRYYDPQTGRFINSDGIIDVDREVGANMFAYCGNNPVNREDPTGRFWNVVVGALGGAVLGGAIEIIGQLATGKSFDNLDWGSVLIEAGAGAASGALLSCGIPIGAMMVGNAAINATASVGRGIYEGKGVIDIAKGALFSVGVSLVTGGIKVGASSYTNYANRMRHAIPTAFDKVVAKVATNKATSTVATSAVIRTVTKSTTVNAPTITPAGCPSCGRPRGTNGCSW